MEIIQSEKDEYFDPVIFETLIRREKEFHHVSVEMAEDDEEG